MLQQVSGRAGRSQQIGKVIIQTYYPEQPIIQSLQQRDRSTFINQALLEREQFNIPPFGFMTSIIISGSSKTLAEKYAINLIQYPKNDQNIDILGPVEAPIFLLKGKYRYRILLKGRNRNRLNKFTQKMLNFTIKPPPLKVIVDVDPYSFL